MNRDISSGFYWGFPFIVLFLIYTLAGFGYDLRSEFGLVEQMTNLFLIIAVVFLTFIVFSIPTGASKAWFILLLLGTIYFAGEEMSWGQFIFAWETPESWKVLNDQGETNIHNTFWLFDQVPRMLLTLAALIGGIIVPTIRNLRGIEIPEVDRPISGWWPTSVCLPVSVIAISVSLLDDWFAQSTSELLQSIANLSGGELKECFLALFILLYALSAKRRLAY